MKQGLSRVDTFLNDSPIARWYQLHALSLLAYVRQHVPSREDAEDIVVETFIAALEQREPTLFSLNEHEQLAWLRRVAYRKCVDRYRRSTRRPTVPIEEPFETLLENESQGPDQLALRREEDAVLHERLRRLPEQYQTVLQLRFANGLRSGEIGRLLNKSEGAVRTLLSRALNSLRDLYNGQPEESDDLSR